jgi:sugar phosphate isomerase/epimerase
VSLRPQAEAIPQMMRLLPQMRHCHIKDVVKRGDEFYFPAIGQGSLNYPPLLAALAEHKIPCTLEIPMRMHRLADSTSVRSAMPVALEQIVQVLSESKDYIDKFTH